MDDFSEGLFDGPILSETSGVLIGGGVAQVGIMATKAIGGGKYNKYAGLIGAVVGGVAGYLLSRKDREKGVQALAGAMIVGVPRAIEDMALPALGLKGFDDPDLGAYAAEGMNGLGAYSAEGLSAPVEVLSESPGAPGLLAAVGAEEMAGDLGADIEVNGGSFGGGW
jgi:hypothetical protein